MDDTLGNRVLREAAWLLAGAGRSTPRPPSMMTSRDARRIVRKGRTIAVGNTLRGRPRKRRPEDSRPGGSPHARLGGGGMDLQAPEVEAPGHGTGAIRRIELGEHGPELRLHGPLGDAEPAADFEVGVA